MNQLAYQRNTISGSCWSVANEDINLPALFFVEFCKLQTPDVKPWKLSPTPKMSISLAGIPFFTMPHFLAILTAVSVASDPEVAEITLSYPKRLQRRSARGPHPALWVARFTRVTKIWHHQLHSLRYCLDWKARSTNSCSSVRRQRLES